MMKKFSKSMNGIDFGRIAMKAGLFSVLTLALFTNIHLAGAATGDILRQINPTPGGNGRGMAFDGTHLYYTLTGDTNIYETDVFGNPVATIPTPIVNGTQPQGGPLAWDGANLWTINYGTNGDLIQLTPTGTLVSTCNIITTNPGHPALTGLFQPTGPDGLDWTGIPGSELVLSGEGDSSTPNSVVFMNTSCKIQSWFTATPKFGANGTSGVAFDGKNLWQVYPAFPGFFYQIFDQTDLSGVDTGLSFGFSNITATTYNLAPFEDLAYDPVTFAPKCALWANDVGIFSLTNPRSNNITALEIPCGPSRGSISGTKFNDINFNGLKDAGEPGINGWNITLSNSSGIIETQLTSGNGDYSFTNLLPGNYTVAEVIQPGWIQVLPECPPSGTSLTGSCTYSLILSGENIVAKDFGNFQLGKISGTKFNDINGNGIKDPGEPVLPNWVINLRLGNVTESTVTDSNGNYNFSGLLTGTYIISEDLQTGWIQTAPKVSSTGSGTHIVNISTSGTNVTGQDFGNFKLGKISGTKFEDLNANGIKDVNESGLAGWNISISGIDTITNTSVNLSTTTDINGNYNFSGLTAGTYKVSEILQNGWSQTTPANGTYTVTITSGANLTGKDFGNFHKGKITGGGWIAITGDPKATFGIVGQYPDSKSAAQGDVEYQDHIKNLDLKSIQINTVATTLDKKKGLITGLAQVNGKGSYPFVVYIEDNAEPGKGVDVFRISLPTYPYSNGAILSGGNIQIHS